MQKYSKLEVTGEWSSLDFVKVKQVNVSFGSISLNIADRSNEPISQWAYGSVSLVEMNIGSAIFSPDEEESERLTIFDEDAIKYLLSLSKKKMKNPFTRIFRSVSLIFLISICTFLVYKHHRVSLEQLALTITSKEQENFIGGLIISNIQGLEICDANSSNEIISEIIAKEMQFNKTDIKVKFLSSIRGYSLLLPGGVLLIPKNKLNGQNSLLNFETLILNSIKLQKELRPIKIFFSDQKTIDLFYYVIGYFQSLNFSNYSRFKLEDLPLKSLKRLSINDKEWIKIRSLCM